MNHFDTLTLVLWQHVVFLCASRTVFRMSLVTVVRRIFAGDDRVIEICRSVFSVSM